MLVYHKNIYSYLIAVFFFFTFIEAHKDLEEYVQDFILETKRIKIPGYPEAFNPSIIKWKGRWLMSFRVIEFPEQVSSFCSATESELGLIWLDDEFNPVGKPQFIQLDHAYKQRPYLLAEDARLVANEDKLYLIYSANKEAIITDAGFRMYVAELSDDGDCFFAVRNECLSCFEGENPCRREKNWVPFVYENELLLAYQLFPHKIFRPRLDGSECCDTIATSVPSHVWEWGELRGGTPALKLNDSYYLSFFHSCTFLSSVHSNNNCVPHYFIGAYLFSAEPPFEIKYISPEPIIGKNFYHGCKYKPYWHPVCVVFPCGLVIDKNEIWIVYGRQDHEIWMAKFDKCELLDSLIPVSTICD